MPLLRVSTVGPLLPLPLAEAFSTMGSSNPGKLLCVRTLRHCAMLRSLHIGVFWHTPLVQESLVQLIPSSQLGTVMVTSAEDGVHGGLEIVQRSTNVPGPPPVCVKVALGVRLSGLNRPVKPPVTMDQTPVPTLGVLPPRPVVVSLRQRFCGPSTVAVVGG